MARKEGFEPYERCKWQVLKCRQMRSFQGFPSEPLIPLTRHLWSTSWSKRGAIRRCKAPEEKSLHCGSTPPSLPESIYDMCAKVKGIKKNWNPLRAAHKKSGGAQRAYGDRHHERRRNQIHICSVTALSSVPNSVYRILRKFEEDGILS